MFIGIGTSSVILIQPAHQRSTETVQSAPDVKQEQQNTPHVSQSLLHKTTSIQKNLSSLKQWKHGPHITHHHPPQKPTTAPLDYGLSQEQINRIKARFASAEWYESGDDGRFFVYVNEEKRKGKTDEEIAIEMYQKIVEHPDFYAALSPTDVVNSFESLGKKIKGGADMKFFKNNAYWILGIVIGLGIGSIITMHRAQQQDMERRQNMKRKTPEEIPHTTQNEREKTRGNATHSHSHNHQQWPRRQFIPQDTSSDLEKLKVQYREQIIEKRSYECSTFGYYEYDVYPDEYYEKELEILCGDMGPEEAAVYLESVFYYSPALLKRLDTVRAFRYLKTLYDLPETREYAERVIAENPGTEIELEAQFYIAEAIPWRKEFYTEKAEAYQKILEIEPNSINVISGLGCVLLNDDKPIEAISYFMQVNRLNPNAGYSGLGESYEKLGDVKTAWVYYKRALSNGHPQPWRMRMHIKAIEAGDPIYKPVELTPESVSRDVYETKHNADSHVSQERSNHIKVFSDNPLFVEHESTSIQDTSDDNDSKRRAAAQQAHEKFLKHQELSRKEFDDFLQWAETIMNTDAPMDTNNFLIKEMEAHLKGGNPTFDVERIIRAFESFERYGAAEGIKQLQKADPDLAKQVQRLLSEKRAPHQHKQQRRNK